MHGLLLDVRKDVVNPPTRLTPVGSEVRVARPTICPAVRRKPARGAFVLEAAQGELLEVVSALPDPRRLARRLDGRSKRAVRTPMIVMTTSSSTSVKPVVWTRHGPRREAARRGFSLPAVGLLD